MDTYNINGKEYNIIKYIHSEELNKSIPLVDIPMMSDYKWQLGCLQDRIKNPENYAPFEDVEATKKKLIKWLREHKPTT